MNVNTFDRLLDACADPDSYPTTLLRSELFPYALRAYNELIGERASRVFSRDSESEYWKIRFWDCFDGQQGLHPLFWEPWLWDSVLIPQRFSIDTSFLLFNRTAP